ncbi:mandelate racemase/muconate lactonizing enzyme family protein [Microbacterium sp. Au-Mic1]|uniref:mandelate racemase/muconate lactonizing enzyme family protein n=1 Tax=Microbacterium sp. Au-Mic1 TaxID=2906457 RepID=UPI001E58EDEF|nr:mandelate racemase/muconate lactonizing enzyme family protein [Microbacterium sp. Au-Mic1]MCE4026256.1 mandelate racemase/muconate lactonizing enzyme family protein [Microbacterium sp. Au-Mic1]
MTHGSTIVSAEAWLVDLPVETKRTDAVQAFVKQETIFVSLQTADRVGGLGYTYTIGTGGRAVLEMLRGGLLDAVVGQDAERPEAVWYAAFNSTRATTVGPITSLALAAIDTAVWDGRSRRASLPLWKLAGGSSPSVPIYDTEGGWLHLSPDELVAQARSSRDRGLPGVKIKVGLPNPHDDLARLRAVREAVGPGFHLMIDANQSLTGAEAIRRARLFDDLDIFWFEEPLPAEDVAGHERLTKATSIPVAVGESMYSVGHFRDFLQRGAASIVQVDVARIGGITPWLKVAHLAESFNVKVAPHFLMELHLSLACAIPNALYLEHIPQLRAITSTEISIRDGRAWAPDSPGLGIDWDLDALDDVRVA